MRTKSNTVPSPNEAILEKLKALESWWDDPATCGAAESGMIMAAGAALFLAANEPGSAARALVILKGASAETGIPVEALARYAEGIRLMREEYPEGTKNRFERRQQKRGHKA